MTPQESVAEVMNRGSQVPVSIAKCLFATRGAPHDAIRQLLNTLVFSSPFISGSYDHFLFTAYGN